LEKKLAVIFQAILFPALNNPVAIESARRYL